jgi:hypothetical protein
MASNEGLGVYLNDHLAGATAGVELARKLQEQNQGTELGEVMAAVAAEIEEDRRVLEQLMERLEVEPQRVKQAAGWVVERLSRLRLNPAFTGGADLTRLLELEALSLGIEGKLALWLALQAAAAGDRGLAPAEGLAGTDFERLSERARSQRRTLEPYRVAAGLRAFSAGE